MASAVPVSNDLLGSSRPQKKTRYSLPKYITKVDGKGHYLRFVFSADSLEKANDVLAALYKESIIDSSYVHAYTRHNTEKGVDYVSVHGVAHVVSRDYDFFFFRKRLPKASFKLTRYPDREYNTSTKEVLATGTVPNSTPGSVTFKSHVVSCNDMDLI